jgi:ribose/xylose/arabinose/galactoside ABC-type transport system permease subunit
MKKILGILGLLVFVCLVSGLLDPSLFLKEWNLGNLVRRSSLFAIISIGVAFVIIAGGIDLSIGSVIALVGCLLPWFLAHERMSVTSAVIAVVTLCLTIGLAHGLLITKLRLQPFVVTLCGLMIYRGIARGITRDRTQGFGTSFEPLRYLANGKPLQMIWFIAAVGVLLIIWALWPRRDRQRTLPRAPLATVGIILGLIASAPLWWASLITQDTSSISPEVFAAMPFWRRAVVEFKAALPMQVPALLFYWLGLATFLVGLIWLTIRSLLASHKTILPILASLAALTLAFFISRAEIERWPDAVDAQIQLPKMWIVIRLTASLGFAAAAIVWFFTASARAIGPSHRSPLLLTVAGGVICLLGFTPLAQMPVPMPFLIMLGLAIVAAIFLNNTIWGRYLFALGRNEQAARYSGINTHSMIILSYVICSLLAGLGAIIFVLDFNSAEPAALGNFYELYAIAAAVLGGCSLRGGEGTVAGVIIGAATMQVLQNSINILDFPTQLEFAIIGTVLLIGVIVDELVKRFAARRRNDPAGFPITPLNA